MNENKLWTNRSHHYVEPSVGYVGDSGEFPVVKTRYGDTRELHLLPCGCQWIRDQEAGRFAAETTWTPCPTHAEGMLYALRLPTESFRAAFPAWPPTLRRMNAGVLILERELVGCL